MTLNGLMASPSNYDRNEPAHLELSIRIDIFSRTSFVYIDRIISLLTKMTWIIFEQYAAITETVRDRMLVLFCFGRLRNNWPMSAHASQAFSASSVPIRGD